MNDIWFTFQHDIGGCGGQFQTRLSMLRDFPEKVVCPSCLMSENEKRTRAMKTFGEAAVNFYTAKGALERDFKLKIIRERG